LLALNLKEAPLIVSLAALNANAELTLEWPDKLEFSRLKLPAKTQKAVMDQLAWIKRQYEILLKNPKSRAYAPHVVPYLAQANLHLKTAGPVLTAAVENLSKLPLAYVDNLKQSLRQTFKPSLNRLKMTSPPTLSGPAVQDRVRFRVVKAEPLNELEAGFMGFYEGSGLSWLEAFERWLALSYDHKQNLLNQAAANQSVKVEYLIEAILEPQLLADGVKRGLFRILSLQAPIPSHGYSLPAKLADGGMLERCFDISYELYGRLQTTDPEAASLACLWGHRQRALIAIDYQNLHNQTSELPNRLAKLASVLQAKLAEKHPLIVDSLEATAKA